MIHGIEAYTDAWTAREARHILRRTLFGPSPAQVDRSVGLGLEATLDQLLRRRAEPDPPVKHVPDPEGEDDFTPNTLYDPDCAYGDTWVDAPPFPSGDLRNMERNRILRYRRKSLDAWTFLLMRDGELSIREKLTMFWHNHYVAADFTLAGRSYRYAAMLRDGALGNVRELTKRVTVDTGMLRYLNGTDNTRRAPNENYARELLELFTVGKGELAGPGDYSTFTEEDVVVMARVLTGWQVPPSRRGDTLTASFVASRHTLGDKQLSHRFGNAVIREAGEKEYEDLIDLIFEQPACSFHLSRELYRWFVGSQIDAEVETEIIEPLAATMRAADYEIVPVLRQLLASQHFFAHRGCMLKNPVDLLLSASQGLGALQPGEGPEADYAQGVMMAKCSEELGMGVFLHPSVAGWEAYHQAPQYQRYWLNNLTYPKRHAYTTALIKGGTIETPTESFRIEPLVPVLEAVAEIEGVSDPNALIFALSERMYPERVSEEQKDYLKEVLIPGLPDYEWTVEYSDYLADPEGPARRAVEGRLQQLFAAMIQLPEFQLM